RMQVEVSKHTEGTKEKMLRPNGLPESLIRYDGRTTVRSSPTAIVRRLESLDARTNFQTRLGSTVG
ncbi:phototropin, partial [Trifolium pratense]